MSNDRENGAPDADLSIGELSRESGVPAHTLRYYEDEGLMPRVERNEAGHRRYRPDHLRWLGLLERLRTSGMSIARMRSYVSLAMGGDGTRAERADLLTAHARDIEARIEELEACLAIVRAKIDLYEGRLDDPRAVWALVEKAKTEPAHRTRGLRSPV